MTESQLLAIMPHAGSAGRAAVPAAPDGRDG
jgi:hypothetical protein